jgi:hypothetical protein
VNDGATMLYVASKRDCDRRALKPRCCPKQASGRVPRSIHEGARDMARQIARSWEGRTSRRLRKKIEMLFAHLKRILKLDRLRLRGPNGARDEFTLAATAQNLRKMTKLIPMPAPMPARGRYSGSATSRRSHYNEILPPFSMERAFTKRGGRTREDSPGPALYSIAISFPALRLQLGTVHSRHCCLLVKKPLAPRPEARAGLSPALERNIHALVERQRSEQAQATLEQKVADAITAFTGSMTFVYLHLTGFGFWTLANVHLIPAVPA